MDGRPSEASQAEASKDVPGSIPGYQLQYAYEFFYLLVKFSMVRERLLTVSDKLRLVISILLSDVWLWEGVEISSSPSPVRSQRVFRLGKAIEVFAIMSDEGVVPLLNILPIFPCGTPIALANLL